MTKFLLIILLLVSTNAFSALIKWVDAQGQVHYSDVPPPPGNGIKILNTSNAAASERADESPASSAPSASKTIAEREIELKKAQQAKKEAAAKAAKEQEQAEKRKAYCARLQQNLRALQEGVRMMDVDASGNRSFVSDEQRQQRIEKARQDISTYCK